jgi:hypothetical protein
VVFGFQKRKYWLSVWRWMTVQSWNEVVKVVQVSSVQFMGGG